MPILGRGQGHLNHLLMRKPNEIKQEQMKKGSASSKPSDRGLGLAPAGTWAGRRVQVVPKVSLYEIGTIPDLSQRDPLERIPGCAVLSSNKGGAWMPLEKGESAKEKASGRVAPTSPHQEIQARCLADCCAASKVCS